jgi:hypothetical protein
VDDGEFDKLLDENSLDAPHVTALRASVAMPDWVRARLAEHARRIAARDVPRETPDTEI